MNDQQRAAMQMALEALEAWKQCCEPKDWPDDDEAAITALREALSAESTGTCSASAQPQKSRYSSLDFAKAQQEYLAQTQGEHKTDGSPCWCNPEVTYENPETGAKVIVHKEPQGEDTQCLIYVADVDMPEGFRDHKERIAELEQDPQSKAALDMARDRFAGGGKVIEWVDLTDDEIHAAINEPTEDLEVMMWRANYCRAVIAAFKEKNK